MEVKKEDTASKLCMLLQDGVGGKLEVHATLRSALDMSCLPSDLQERLSPSAPLPLKLAELQLSIADIVGKKATAGNTAGRDLSQIAIESVLINGKTKVATSGEGLFFLAAKVPEHPRYLKESSERGWPPARRCLRAKAGPKYQGKYASPKMAEPVFFLA
jgi:hypothetical protein